MIFFIYSDETYIALNKYFVQLCTLNFMYNIKQCFAKPDNNTQYVYLEMIL